MTPDMVSFIETNFLADATITDGEMATMVTERFGISVRRQLVCEVRNKLKILYRPPFHVQDLTPEHEVMRLTFVDQMLELRRQGQLNHLVFSDESRFCRGPDNFWVRVRRGCWNATATRTKMKFPMGIMVFGAIGVRYKSRIVRCSNGVGSTEYLSLVQESGLPGDANEVYGEEIWHFMQDGAPCHTAAASMEGLQQLMRVLPIWPPNSPDLNPIEMLWSIIARKLVPLNVKNEEELFAEVERVWNELDQGMIDRLVGEFWWRCELVQQVRGKTISQLLSSHIRVPRPQDIGTAMAEDFSPEFDQMLLAAVAQMRRTSWAKLSRTEAFEGHAPRLLKQRWQFLTYQARNEEWQAIREEFDFGEADAFDADAGDDDPEDEDDDDGLDADDGEAADEDDSPDEGPGGGDDDDQPTTTATTPVRRERGPPLAYILFAKDHKADAAMVGKDRIEVARALGQMWKAASEEEKAKWFERATLARKAVTKGRGRPKKK